MVELTRVYHFSAAHQLRNLSLSPEQNAALYGDCHRPHGHNYYLEVTRRDRAVSGAVLAEVDHHALEEVPALRGVITAGESLARAFWRILVPALPAGSLRRVTVVETAKNRFDYEGGERCSKS